MNVYRIQDKEGRGPWKPGFSRKWVEPREDHRNLKTLFEEFTDFDIYKELRNNEHCGCACTTIDQLKRWFNETEYKKLILLGYRAVAIKPDRILRESENQCVFARKKPLSKSVSIVNLY